MILVTGGTGLVGGHLLYELAKTGKPVKALKRPASNLGQTLKIFSFYEENPEPLFNRIEWVEGDTLDYFSLEKILEGVDEVFHCAALVSFDSSERKKMIANNVEGTANLVNAAIENSVKQFCHVSSVASLGRTTNGEPVSEQTAWVPSKKMSGYSESKFFSEAEVWRGIEEGLNAVIVNPSVILGPGNWSSGSPKFFKTVHNGLKFYTRGTTGFVDVRDVVKAMLLLMEPGNFEKYKNQRFLLNAANLCYQDLFSQIAGALGKPRPRYFASDFILSLGWRGNAALSFVTRKPPLITREAVSGSNATTLFDGTKICQSTGFVYCDISETIKKTAEIFRKDFSISGKQD